MIRERLNLAGILVGLIFIAVGTVVLLDHLDIWDLRLEVIWPAVLVVGGVLLVLSTLVRRR